MQIINGQQFYSEEEAQIAAQSAVDQAKKAFEKENRRDPNYPDFMKPQKSAEREELKEKTMVVSSFVQAISNIQNNHDIHTGMKRLDELQSKYPEWYQKEAVQIAGNVPQWQTKAAFSEASNGAGLFTVPTFWSDMIFDLVPKFGYARALATVMPMPALTVNLTTGGAVIVSYPGNNTAATPFDATSFFTQTPVTANTMAAAQIIQKELLQDTAVPILQYLTEKTALAIAREEDRQLFSGTGAPFTGITNTNGVVVSYLGNNPAGGKTSVMGSGYTPNISWQDLVFLQQQINTEALSDAAFFMTQFTYMALRQEASATRPIWDFMNPAAMAGQQGFGAVTGNNGVAMAPRQVWSPLAFPCYVLDASADPNGNYVMAPPTTGNKPAVIFGNLKKVMVGIRQEIVMETFDQAYGGVDLSGQRQIAMVSYLRHGIGIPLPSAYAVLKTDIS